jgi:CRP-like cAMP-binding protein
MLPDTPLTIFDTLPPDDRRSLAPLLRPVSFRAGETIFSQGEAAATVYVLTQGAVALRLRPEDGGCLTIAVIHRDGVFGWSAVLGRARYTSAAVCQADGAALALRGSDLRGLLRAQPALGRALLDCLTRAMTRRPDAERPRPGTEGALARLSGLIQAEMLHAAP